jgi:Kelch motif
MLVFRGMCIALYAFCSSHVFSQSVTEVGSLSLPTIGHSATLLDNGKVLLVAADGRGELFDPTTNTWSLTNAMAVGSSAHSAVKLTDGKVLVFGGLSASGEPFSRAELYNPVTGVWSTTGSLTAARASNSVTLVPNGRVIAVGGQGANSTLLASIEEFDPSTAVWTTIGSLPQARKDHTATSLESGEILFLGGTVASAQNTTDCLRFNRAAMTFAACAAIPIARAGHRVIALPNNRFLAVGGVGATGGFESIYDVTTDSWALTTLAARTYSNHAAIALRTNSVLVLGGAKEGGYSVSPSYDTSFGSFKRFFSDTGSTEDVYFFQRAGHTLTQLPDGRILVAGGYSAFNQTLFVLGWFFTPIVDSRTFVIDRANATVYLGASGNSLAGGRTPFWPETNESFFVAAPVQPFAYAPSIPPTGTVTISDGATSCTAMLPSSTCRLRSATSGTKHYSATYSGDDEYLQASVTYTRPTGNRLYIERFGEVVNGLSVSSTGYGLRLAICGGFVGPISGNCDLEIQAESPVEVSAGSSSTVTFVGWQGACAGSMSPCNATMPASGSLTVRAVFASASSLPLKLDIDANGVVDAATDGQLIRRFMSRVHDVALTQSVLGNNPQRTSSDEIEDRLNSMTPLLDVDQNGRADAMTDGVVILRFLLGFRNDALTQNAIGVGARRTDPTEISAHLQSMMP